MAWTDRMSVYARCPVHPRYRPDAGQGAIKAGCQHCWELFDMHRSFEALRRKIKVFCDATALRRAA